MPEQSLQLRPSFVTENVINDCNSKLTKPKIYNPRISVDIVGKRVEIALISLYGRQKFETIELDKWDLKGIHDFIGTDVGVFIIFIGYSILFSLSEIFKLQKLKQFSSIKFGYFH